MPHAIYRALDRAAARTGLSPVDVIRRAQSFTTEPGNLAVCLCLLPAHLRTTDTDASNGDAIWAVIRNHHLITLMLRRSTQPATPAALKVDTVLFAA